MSSKLLVGTLVCSMLFGCARAPSRMASEPLAFELPAAWSVNDSASQVSHSSDGWLSQLGDPAVNEYVRRALENNPNLNALKLKADVFKLDYFGARKDMLPSANLEYSSQRQQITRGSLPSLEEGDTSQISLTVDWEVDVWGRLRHAKKAAYWQYQSEKDTFDYAQLSLAIQSAKAWYEYVEANLLAELSERELNSWQLSKEVLNRSYRDGVGTATALHQLDSQLSISKAQALQARITRDNAKRRLFVLLGDFPEGDLPLMALQLPAAPVFDERELPLGVLAKRPDVKAAMAKLKAADASAFAAYRALYPQFKLSLVSALVSGQLTSFDPSANTVTGSLSVLQPIFSRNNLKIASSKAQLSSQQEYWRYVEAILAASENILSKTTGQKNLVEQLAAKKTALQATELALSAAKEDYLTGVADVQVWLQVQREYLSLKREVVRGEGSVLGNWLDVQLAVAAPIYSDVERETAFRTEVNTSVEG